MINVVLNNIPTFYLSFLIKDDDQSVEGGSSDPERLPMGWGESWEDNLVGQEVRSL